MEILYMNAGEKWVTHCEIANLAFHLRLVTMFFQSGNKMHDLLDSFSQALIFKRSSLPGSIYISRYIVLGCISYMYNKYIRFWPVCTTHLQGGRC